MKHPLSIIALFSLILLGSCTGFFSDSHENTENPQINIQTNPQSHPKNLGDFTQTQIPTAQTTQAQHHTTVETDTPKHLTTYTTGNTAWGISPFGSGKPLEETANTHTGVFKQPNTEWKTRTLSGITYVFGEGNPREVALDDANIRKLVDCEPPYDDPIRSCYDGRGYVSPQYEKDILTMLESPLWEKIITECASEYSQATDDRFQRYVVSASGRDVNNFLSVDPITGLKTEGLDTQHTSNLWTLKNALYSVNYDGMVKGDWTTPCMARYAPPLVSLIQQAERSFQMGGLKYK